MRGRHVKPVLISRVLIIWIGQRSGGFYKLIVSPLARYFSCGATARSHRSQQTKRLSRLLSHRFYYPASRRRFTLARDAVGKPASFWTYFVWDGFLSLKRDICFSQAPSCGCGCFPRRHSFSDHCSILLLIVLILILSLYA